VLCFLLFETYRIFSALIFDDVCVLCSVSVLVHNTSRNVFVFVRQFRPGEYFYVLYNIINTLSLLLTLFALK